VQLLTVLSVLKATQNGKDMSNYSASEADSAAGNNDETTTGISPDDDPGTAPAPSGTETEHVYAWSLDRSEEPSFENKWRGRLQWAGLVALLCATIAAVVWFSMTFYFEHWSTSNTGTPGTSAPAAQAPVPAPAPPPASAPTSVAARPPSPIPVPAPPPRALPVAVVGSSCRPTSTPTVDPDGATVYCALFPDMPETSMWSRTPGPLSWPSIGGVRVPDQVGSYPWVVICEQQTGRSYNYCESAIAQATYQGDGPIPES
jgi:hypothetical protein